MSTINRAGRLQLPADYIEALGMRDRVRLNLEADHISVWPGQDPHHSPGGQATDTDQSGAR